MRKPSQFEKSVRWLTIVVATVGVAFGLLAKPALALTFQLGDVFASVNSGQVQVWRGGVLQGTLNTGLGGFTTGSTTDSAGNFYVTNFTNGSVTKFDKDGNNLGTVATGFTNPESIVFGQNGTAYVGDAGQNNIHTFNPPGNVGPVTIGPRGTDWIDLAANQTTLFYTSEGNGIYRYDLVGGQLSNFNVALLPGTNAFALRILANGNVLVADGNMVVLLDSAGNVIKTFQSGTGYDFSNGEMFSLNLIDQTHFWTGNDSTGILYQLDLDGNLIATINTGVGGGNLFGVSVYGEFTAGGGGVGNGNTPLPGALPMFVSGLGGAFGLLRWRRKRKAAAVAV